MARPKLGSIRDSYVPRLERNQFLPASKKKIKNYLHQRHILYIFRRLLVHIASHSLTSV